MALNLFPTTRTLAWSVIKSPNWATRMQRSISGREVRVNDYVLPIYTFTLTWEVLRDRWDVRDGAGKGHAYPGGTPLDELREIWNFFNRQRGAAIPFMFNDVTDNTTRTDPTVARVINFATGDGVTRVFQMASELMAPVIPVTVNSTLPDAPHSIDLNTGLIQFTTAPLLGLDVGADMTYNYKVRFAVDNLEAENFMHQLWTMKSLKLTSVLY